MLSILPKHARSATRTCQLLSVLVFLLLGSAIQLPAQPASATIVSGTPPITMDAIQAHIRLFEFVLDIQLTIAQKAQFLDLVKVIGPAMKPEERKGFLEAIECANSLSGMNAFQQQAAKDVLKTDFEQSLHLIFRDPSAQMFFLLKGTIPTSPKPQGNRNRSTTDK